MAVHIRSTSKTTWSVLWALEVGEGSSLLGLSSQPVRGEVDSVRMALI
jgi:hypothetical protein